MLGVVTLATLKETTKGLTEIPSGEIIVASKCALWILVPQESPILYAGLNGEPEQRFGKRLEARFKELGAVRYLEFAELEGLFICDRDGCVVSSLINDTVVPFVGSPTAKGSQDGPRQEATLNFPTDVAVFKDHMFITDYSSDKVRMVTPSGMVSSIGGGTQTRLEPDFASAEFKNPFGLLATDTELYVSEHIRSRIRRINLASSTVSLVSGTDVDGFRDGPGDIALWNMVRGLTSDPSGNIYVADCRNDAIRRITSNGETETVFGKPGSQKSVDGPINCATITRPFFTLITSSGDLMWTEEYSSSVRSIVGFTEPCLPTPPLLPFCPTELLSSSSPSILLTMFPVVQLPMAPYSIHIVPDLIKLTLPSLDSLSSIQSFIDSCPCQLQPSLHSFLLLLHRSTDLFCPTASLHSPSTSSYSYFQTASTISHILQLLHMLGCSQNHSIRLHLTFKFSKLLRFLNLSSLLSLLDSKSSVDLTPIFDAVHPFITKFKSEELEHGLSSISLSEPYLCRVRTLPTPSIITRPKLCLFQELYADLQRSFEHNMQSNPFTITITDTDYSASVEGWILASQWSWFRCLLESGMSEVVSRCIELPSSLPPPLLDAILKHFIFDCVPDIGKYPAIDFLAFVEQYGGQFGFTDFTGQPTPSLALFITRLRRIANNLKRHLTATDETSADLQDLFGAED